ncbi:regulator [Actinoplanes utahensis]|uniref:Regulator n=1 Tax=Actinoplanes utahensis TaxID=1869 RepID=A0A0A6UJT8_ACTUT|nr:regulator [Actinoplanes utahensis]
MEAKGLRVDLSRARWFKSSRSGPGRDDCVEVAFVGEAIAVRDSKNPAGAALIFTAAEWDAFVDGAKDGEFDL